MSNSLSMRKFVENYENGLYDKPDQSAIQSIWQDWSVTERDLQHRTRPLAKKVMRFLKVAEDEIDLDKTSIHFRNINPVKGRPYDSFTITDTKSQKVLFFICPNIGYDAARGKAQLLSVPEDKHIEIFDETYGLALDTLKAMKKSNALVTA